MSSVRLANTISTLSMSTREAWLHRGDARQGKSFGDRARYARFGDALRGKVDSGSQRTEKRRRVVCSAAHGGSQQDQA